MPSILKELRDNVFLLVIAVLPIAVGSRRLRQTAMLPLLYFIASFAVMFARAKSGADSNYYLEWEAALCLCAGLSYSFLRREWKWPSARFVLPLVLACAALGSGLWTIHHRDPLKIASLNQCADAYQFVKQHPGDRLLSENIGAVLMAGKHELVSDRFMWGQEVMGRRWSGAPIADLIRSRRIDLIVLKHKVEVLRNDPNNRWPPAVLDAISSKYVLTRTYACDEAEAAYQPATP